MLKLFISFGTFFVWFFSCLSGMALLYYSLIHWWPEVPWYLQGVAMFLGLTSGLREAYNSYGK